MFFLFPLGVGAARVRLPVIGAIVVLLCLSVFVPTWLLADDPLNQRPTAAALEYWGAHPWLDLDRDFVVRTLGRPAARKLDTAIKNHEAKIEAARPGGPVELGQQVHLDRLIEAATSRKTLMRRFALVPERGVAQPGWISAMFLHFGWMHLLGNLFFLWLAAPLLEDAWGRRIFLVFYLLSGLAAAFAHYLTDPSSAVSMGGASGAIAGLMGAFAVRFPTRRIAMGYLFFLGRIWRGVWRWPAWFAALLWFLNEVANFLMGQTGGVAVGAHIGGFVFGAGVALSMKAIGLDRTLVTTDEAHVDLNRRLVSRGVEAAEEALRERDVARARATLEETVAKDPHDSDALVMLAGLELSEGKRHQGEQLFARALLAAQRESPVHAALLWHEHGERFGANCLEPLTALRLAQAVSKHEEPNVAASSLALLARAAEFPGLMGVRAGLEAAERYLKESNDTEVARALLKKVLTSDKASEAMRQRAQALLDSLPSPSGTSGLETADSRSFSTPVEVDAAQAIELPLEDATLRGLTERALLVSTADGVRELEFVSIESIGLGVVPLNGAKVLILLVFPAFGAPLRFTSTSANLQAFRSAPNGKELYRAFVLELLSHGAQPLFDRQRLEAGQFPTFDAPEALEAASRSRRASGGPAAS